MSIQVILGGYDVTAYYKAKSGTIQDFPGGEVGNCTLVLENPLVSNDPGAPTVHNPTYPSAVTANMPDPDYLSSLVRLRPLSGMLLTVRDTEDTDGVNIFVGVIIRKPELALVETEDGDSHYVYTVTAATAGWSIDGRFVTDIWEDKQTLFIARNILETYAKDFDCSEIPTSGAAAGRYRRPSYIVERRKVREALDDLLQGEGMTWYIEESEPFSLANTKKVKIGPPAYHLEPYEVSDEVDADGEIPVNNLLSKPLTVDAGDISQVRNVIYYTFYGEYATFYGGSGSTTDPANYDKGLAQVALGDTAVAPLGTANFSSYVKAGAVFYKPGSNYRYTVQSVFPNGNVIISPAWQETSGDVPFVFSNVPTTIKLREQSSIEALETLLDADGISSNNDTGEREFAVTESKLMLIEQGVLQARAQLNDRVNPMVRMVIETDTYKLRKQSDGSKFYPKAGRAVRFNLTRRAVQGTFVQKQITWKDTGALDVDYRQIWDLSISFNDRIFALSTIMRKLIDGQNNGFAPPGSQVIFDVLDMTEDFGPGAMADEVRITDLVNPALAETVLLTDVLTLSTPAAQADGYWADLSSPLSDDAEWGTAHWTDVP